MSKRQDDVLGPTTDRRFFKEKLTSRMKELNLFPAELARQARISKDAVSSYMSMRSLPNPTTLEKLAKVLKCKATELVPSPGETLDDDIIEVRKDSRSGYQVLICRVSLPETRAWEWAATMSEEIKKHRADGAAPPKTGRRNGTK